jgi:hypothetical protein
VQPDPLSLPYRFDAHDTRADGGVRQIELHRERVVLRRAVLGMRMSINVRVSDFSGIALRQFADAQMLVLLHRDRSLTIPLCASSDRDEIAEAWVMWSEIFALPQLTETKPREPALRRARVCYDHLAGEVGVQLFDALVERGWLAQNAAELSLTSRGVAGCRSLGLDPAPLARSRRPLCRTCLDWSERRHHLAGALGASLLRRMVELHWARRVAGSRVVKFTPDGEAALRAHFGIA